MPPIKRAGVITAGVGGIIPIGSVSDGGMPSARPRRPALIASSEYWGGCPLLPVDRPGSEGFMMLVIL